MIPNVFGMRSNVFGFQGFVISADPKNANPKGDPPRNVLHYQLVAIGLLPRVIDYTVHIYSVQECLALSIGSNWPSATRH